MSVRRRLPAPARPGSRGAARTVTMVLLLALAASASGCAFQVLGRRVGLPLRSHPPRETAHQRQVRELSEAATLAPSEPYWPYALARLYVDADSLGRAEALLERSLARRADYAPALALRASLDYAAGRHDRAIRALEAALARPGAFPGGPPRELLEGLALHYEAAGQPERARATVASLPPRRPAPALVYLGLRGDAPENVAEAAESAMRAEPGSAANQNNFGIARLRAGDPIAARKALERAVALDSTLAGPYYNLAILEKYYLFEDARAAAWFERYWRLSQDDPDGLAAEFGRTPRPALARDGD